MSSWPPGLLMIIGGLLLPCLPKSGRRWGTVLLPLASGLHLLWLVWGELPDPTGLQLFNQELTLVRIDRLSLVWGTIFHIAALLTAIYSWHVKDATQQSAAQAYAGAAIAAVFAGDLLTLFVFWELTAVTSVFLIWAARTDRSFHAGLRYLIIQIGSGVLLLAGIAMLAGEGGSSALVFDNLWDRFQGGTAGFCPVMLILVAFGIKAAFPLLHNWLQDAYPEATVTGTVWLSAFTTKLAIYALARGFAGADCLVWIGAAMTVFPIFFAVIENDLRRVLAYSLNNQLGFMVVGIGIGTEMALNGTAAHAFAHILYKALLFMSIGAVLYRTGTAKASELGGLYKSMPWTCGFCIVGAASISAVPLFSGFVTKSLILEAAVDNHYSLIYLIMLFASVGVLEHSGIKIPYFAFFGRDQGHRVSEAPRNMLIAMGITAAMCIGIGIFPEPLYRLLPFETGIAPYETYRAGHLISQLQLLAFAALAFTVLIRTGIYPPELRALNLDTDWFYRKPLPAGIRACWRTLEQWRSDAVTGIHRLADPLRKGAHHLLGPGGLLARTWSTAEMVLWVAILLGISLVVYYL
ncbi:MAG: Na(+)/H(+) antiporter subunit D [Planctomycetaceae bacterium]|nr:Na(+)/H(+) antiporter subunit D [Planctomycetaceae bacterium]MDP7275522.1 Na(+)/H(+) antiporter subunit D [Planctomycetaceae bacterium]